MTQTPTVTELRSFTFTVVAGNEPSLSHPVGRLTIQEAKVANSRGGLIETAADYGFRLVDETGRIVAEIAPGFYPFFKKVVELAAPLQSPACEEDCLTEIGALTVIVGETENGS